MLKNYKINISQTSRYNSSELPTEEAAIKTWCEKAWSQKETTLEEFYKEKTNRTFSPAAKNDRPWNCMYFALVGWTLFTWFTIYLTFTNSLAFYWVLLSIISFVTVSYFSIGIQQFEIDLFNKFDKNANATIESIPSHGNCDDNSKKIPLNDNYPNNKVSCAGYTQDDLVKINGKNNSFSSSSDTIPVNGRDKKVS